MDSDDRAIIEQGLEWAALETKIAARRRIECGEDEVRFLASEMQTYTSERLGQVTIPDGLVSLADACPKCGERDEDNLICHEDDEMITCATCGNVYELWIDYSGLDQNAHTRKED